MNLAAIEARLVSQVAALGSRVGGAAELQAAIENTHTLSKPSAWVIWSTDLRQDQSLVPGQAARFAETFSVVVAVDNTRDGKDGRTATVDADTLGASIKTALVGWVPVAGNLPVTYEGASFSTMDAHALIHAFDFSSVNPGGSIFSYQIAFTANLVEGKTVSDISALFATKIDAVIGGSTRLASDYLINRESIPESATRYQLQIVPSSVDETADIGAALEAVSVRVVVYHHLAPGDTERTYTETTMAQALEALLPPSYWRDPTNVEQVTDGPSLSIDGDVGRE